MWPSIKWLRANEQTYTAVQDDDTESQPLTKDTEKSTHPHSKTNPRHHITQKLQSILLPILTITAIYILTLTAYRYTLHPHPITLEYESRTLTCGTTVAEAEASNCVFDVLSHYWLPTPCMDYTIRDAYREFLWDPDRLVRQFPYFYDDKTTWVRNEKTLSHSLHKLIYTTQEEHLAHCDYLLRRIHRAAQGEALLDGLVGGMPHTRHCINELRDPRYQVNGNLSVAFYVSFSNCTVQVPVGTT